MFSFHGIQSDDVDEYVDDSDDDDDDDDIQEGWPVGLIDIDDALRRVEQAPRPPQASLAHPPASCDLCQTPGSRDPGDQDGDDIDAR